jgi:hypothetical protein
MRKDFLILAYLPGLTMQTPELNSTNLARYIEATDGISKPWLLVMLRMQKLKERRAELSMVEYEAALQELHEDLMKLGEWWVGMESEVF